MNRHKIILDLCGGTGSWSKPYQKAGYDVRVITLPDNDVRLYIPPENVYGILVAPPCDEFSKAKQFHGKGNYSHNFLAGLEVVSACMRIILTCKPKFWAMENPATGFLKRWLKEPLFTFNPWQYGDNYQKNTAIWGGVQRTRAHYHKKAGWHDQVFHATQQGYFPGVLRYLYTAGAQGNNAAGIRKGIFLS